MKVSEIFKSIEGEGKRAGLPCTFIRLFGCNLRCLYCDSLYACDGDDYYELDIDEILEAVEDRGCPNVTVTGGEPLIHEDIDKLLIELVDAGYWVNVETNGTVIPQVRRGHIFYTVDYKTRASGMTAAMNKEVFKALNPEDVVKFVVGSVQDLQQSLEFVSYINPLLLPQVYVSPVFGMIEPKEIVNFLLDKELYDWKVQLQLHRFIWEPTMRGV